MIEYFERRASTYAQKSERGLWRAFRARELDAVLGLMDPAPGRTAIDLGCGAGYYARRLADQYGLAVTAVDSSPSMLAAIGDRKIRTCLGRIEHLGGIGQFDYVLAAGVLEFVSDLRLALVRCRELMEPNGKLVLLVPTSGITGWLYERAHALRNCPVHNRTLNEYISAAAAAGLELTASTRCTPISTAMAFRLARH